MFVLALRLRTTFEYLRRQGFIARPARYKCTIENLLLKLTTKSQIEIRLPEILLLLAIS